MRSPSSSRSLPTLRGRGVHQAVALYYNILRMRCPSSSRYGTVRKRSPSSSRCLPTLHGRGIHQAIALYHNTSRTRSPSRSCRSRCPPQHLTVADCNQERSCAAVAGHIVYHNTSQLQIASNNAHEPQSLVTVSIKTLHIAGPIVDHGTSSCTVNPRTRGAKARNSESIECSCAVLESCS